MWLSLEHQNNSPVSWETVTTVFNKKSFAKSFPARSIFQVQQVIKKEEQWSDSLGNNLNLISLLFPHIFLEWIPRHQRWAEIFEEAYRQELCGQFDVKAQ